MLLVARTHATTSSPSAFRRRARKRPVNPVAPVIKISSNSTTYQRMKDFIDIDAGKILEGASIPEVAGELYDFLIEVCNAKETAAERNRCREFAINRIGPTF